MLAKSEHSWVFLVPVQPVCLLDKELHRCGWLGCSAHPIYRRWVLCGVNPYKVRFVFLIHDLILMSILRKACRDMRKLRYVDLTEARLDITETITSQYSRVFCVRRSTYSSTKLAVRAAAN